MAKKLDSLSPRTKADTSKSADPQPVEVITPTKPVEEPKPEKKEAAPVATPATPATAEPVKESPAADTAAPTTETTPPTEGGDTFESMFPEPTVSITRPPALILWALLLVASIVVAAVGYKLINPKLDTWLSVAPTPTPTATATPSASPTASATPTADPTASPTLAPTPTATPTPSDSPAATAKSAITMRVLNGTKASGAAGTARTTLTKAGFTVRTIGNAKNQDYTDTYVYYQSGRKAEADQVAAALSSYKPVLQESSLASPDMVLVVIGK